MRILVLTLEYPPLGGGASASIFHLCQQFARTGHQVDVVTMGFKELPALEQQGSLTIHRVKCRRRQKHISNILEHVSFILSAKRYLGILLKHQPFDICHTHFILPTGLIARWVKKEFGIPYIITPHGSDVPSFNPDRFVLIHKFTSSSIQSIVRQSAKVITPSKHLLSLLKRVIESPHMLTIPVGVDTNEFKPGEKKNIILSTGRLFERKGFQYLIEALSDMDCGYEIHICGDGPMMPHLKESASCSATKVVLHGWLDNTGDEYKSLLKSASIYSLVSSSENASNSLLEALASGCAVVTSDVSGCPESVGGAGICIPPEDVNQLRTTLTRLIKDDSLRLSCMQASRKRAEDVFSWEKIARQYLHHLEEAAKT